jgi:DNA repair protein RadC
METIENIAEIELVYRPAISNKPVVASSSDAYLILKEHYNLNTIALQESFVVLYLNQFNRVIGLLKMTVGGITGTIVDLRILFATALKAAATGIIISHNHPSGNPKPSVLDLKITGQIKEAGKLFDIRLLDHLIIAPDDKYTSMADNGDLR